MQRRYSFRATPSTQKANELVARGAAKVFNLADRAQVGHTSVLLISQAAGTSDGDLPNILERLSALETSVQDLQQKNAELSQDVSILIQDKRIREASADVHNLNTRTSTYLFTRLFDYMHSAEKSESLSKFFKGEAVDSQGKLLRVPHDLGAIEWIHRHNPPVQKEIEKLVSEFAAKHNPPLDPRFLYGAHAMGEHGTRRHMTEHRTLRHSYRRLQAFLHQEATLGRPPTFASLLPANAEGDITPLVHALGTVAEKMKNEIEAAETKEQNKERG